MGEGLPSSALSSEVEVTDHEQRDVPMPFPSLKQPKKQEYVFCDDTGKGQEIKP